MIYHDLNFDFDRPTIPFEFNQVLYEFYVKGIQNVVWMEVASLPVVPRVGENIDLPFFKAYLDTTGFYVDSVQHKFRDNLQVVHITLKCGDYNLYWHYRKDKAWEEHELPLYEMIHMDDWEMKRRLKVGGHLY